MAVESTVYFSLNVPTENQVVRLDISGILLYESDQHVASVVIPAAAAQVLGAEAVKVPAQSGVGEIDVCFVHVKTSKLVYQCPTSWDAQSFLRFPENPQSRPALDAARQLVLTTQCKDVTSSSDDAWRRRCPAQSGGHCGACQ